MDNCSQYEIISQLRIDEAGVFEALYEKYHMALYSNIYKLCKDDNATQDILQEVFVALWEKRLTIDANQSVSNWLFTVSYNKTINYLKKLLKDSAVLEHLSDETQIDEENEINLREIQFYLIERAVSQLSPQKRKVFHFCKLQGKSYEETAKELNISKHTVKEYLSEAVMNVREYIKKHPASSTAFFCATLLSSPF